MLFVRQNTESQFFIGPVLDADGLPVTTATNSDFRYVLSGAAGAIPAGITITHQINGHYLVAIVSPIIDAPKSFAIIAGNASLAMPPSDFAVITAAAWDSLFSATASGGGLDAAGVRSAIGLANSDLDAQLASKPSYGDSQNWNNGRTQLDVTVAKNQ